MRRFNSKGEPHPGPTATLEELLEWARSYVMTPAEVRAQRISWAAGQCALSNPTKTLEEWRTLTTELYDELYGKGEIDAMKNQHKFKRLKYNEESEWYRCLKCEKLTRDPSEAYKEECPVHD